MTFKEFKTKLEEAAVVPTVAAGTALDNNQKALITYNTIKAYAQQYKSQLGQISSIVKTAWNNINKDEKYLAATDTQPLSRLAKKYINSAAAAAIERKATKSEQSQEASQQPPEQKTPQAAQTSQLSQKETSPQQVAVGALAKDEMNAADLEISDVIEKFNKKSTFDKLLNKFSEYINKDASISLAKEQPIYLTAKGKTIAIPIRVSLNIKAEEEKQPVTAIEEAQEFIAFLEKVKYNEQGEKALKKLVEIIAAAMIKKFGGKDGFQVTADKKNIYTVRASVDPKLIKLEDANNATFYLELRHLNQVDPKNTGGMVKKAFSMLKPTKIYKQ